MSIDTGTGSPHPIARALAAIGDRLDDVVGARTWSLAQDETSALLREVTRAQARLEELQLRILARARAVKAEDLDGSPSTAQHLASKTNVTRAAAHRMTRLAQALDAPLHEPVQQALAQGRLLVDQASVIIEAVDALPEQFVTEQMRVEAQEVLLKEAEKLDAKALRIIGRRILEHVAPEVAEAWEAKRLADEEREAEAAAVLRMYDDGHGKTHGKFTLPTAVADQLRAYLRAYAAPKHRRANDDQPFDDQTPSAHKMGLAFIEFICRYPVDRVPYAGGVSATTVVTIPVETLRGGLKAAQLDTGTRISAGLARRWACEAGIIPVVLGGRSQVLDLGRKRRLHTEGQRIALGLEQGGCTVQGCDTPAGMCHVHHEWQWKDGGPTDLAHARLLCPRHHARAHDPAYTTSKLSGGKITFTRRR